MGHNPSKSQRVTPPRHESLAEAQDIGRKERLSPVKKNQQLALAAYWDLLRQLGWKLDAKEMSLRFGKHRTWATQRLNGHAPLSTDDMLLFARALDAAPQVIWEDWPYADLTATPSLMALNRQWSKLAVATRTGVLELLRLNGHLVHHPTSRIITVERGSPPLRARR
jgi:hypothetical protein